MNKPGLIPQELHMHQSDCIQQKLTQPTQGKQDFVNTTLSEQENSALLTLIYENTQPNLHSTQNNKPKWAT
jgi:hypothetical protein